MRQAIEQLATPNEDEELKLTRGQVKSVMKEHGLSIDELDCYYGETYPEYDCEELLYWLGY